jgi:hypothetical protein
VPGDMDIRSKVLMMRELGIVQLDGITLGPAPARAVALAHAIEAAPEKTELKQELAEALRNDRIEAERGRLQDLLGRELRAGEFEHLANPRAIDP